MKGTEISCAGRACGPARRGDGFPDSSVIFSCSLIKNVTVDMPHAKDVGIPAAVSVSMFRAYARKILPAYAEWHFLTVPMLRGPACSSVKVRAYIVLEDLHSRCHG